MRRKICTGVVGLGLFVSAGLAAPRPLDIYLNTIQLDAHTDKRVEDEFLQVGRDKPLGQTFRTGPKVEKIYRIAIWQAFWNESWHPDEVLVMTLWDSPAKRHACGRFAIPYFQRMWEGAIPMFTLDARVEPDREYYFELTVETESLRPAEVPTEWLLTKTRPGFAGGDAFLDGIGKSSDDYAAGQAYVGGEPQDFDVWFHVHVRKQVDRDELYRQAFNRLDLDYPPLAKVRELVEAKRWDDAVAELVRYFETQRTDLVVPEKRQFQFDPTYDTREADLASIQQVWVHEDGSIVNMAPYWNYYALWPQRGGVGLTRGGLRKPLGEAYAKTGNEKYARAFNEMLADFYVSLPSPALNGAYGPDEPIPAALPAGTPGGSMWSALSVGARILHGFHYYSIFADSPFFTQDVRAKWIFNMGELADVLERQKGGGNWETQMADALFQFGVTYPEFKKARERAERGLATLIENAKRTVYPDGALHEPTVNYHGLVLNRYSKVIQQVRDSHVEGLEVPEEMVRLTEKMFEYLMYATLPDGTLPIWGDSNHPTRPDFLERGARMYDRQDFLYVYSNGKQGSPPQEKSYAFPHGGYYYMRNDWSRQSNYMGFRCGPHGSHGHLDPLSIVVAAYGRTVLIDPGIHTYGTPEARELTSTRSHNTVTVDDLDSRSAKANAWVTTPGFDFVAGTNSGYRGLEDVRHHRRVWFLKSVKSAPDLWLVLDDVTGTGEHEVALRYRFAPLEMTHDPDCGCVWTTEDAANLYIHVTSQPAAKLEMGKGIAVWAEVEKRNDRGELLLGDLRQVPLATYRVKARLPLAMTSTLSPSRTRDPMAWHEQLLVCEPSAPDSRAIWLERDNDAVLAACNRLEAFDGPAEPMQVTLPDGRQLRADAVAVALRFHKSGGNWTPTTLHGVRAGEITLAGERLHDAIVEDAVDIVLP
ncbi:MAG TPA: alginate lyase family protein [Phycisphaerae bacterium]|nr:alginate lyase family protein [Phycisphaerae bacterium]